MPITSMRPSLAVDRSSVTLERQGPEFLQTDYRKSRKTEISSPFPLNGGGGARRVENAWLEKRDRSLLDFANKMRKWEYEKASSVSFSVQHRSVSTLQRRAATAPSKVALGGRGGANRGSSGGDSGGGGGIGVLVVSGERRRARSGLVRLCARAPGAPTQATENWCRAKKEL